MAGQAVQIEVIGPDDTRATYEIEEEATVGRGKENTISIKDLAASKCHARIYCSGLRYWVEDLESRNGTTVNGDPVQKLMLKNGDVVEIGQHKLQFSCPEEPEAPEAGLGDLGAATMIQQTIDVQRHDVAKELDQGAAGDRADRLTRHLKTLHDIGTDIGTILELDGLLNRILDHVFKTFEKAERGFILLRHEVNPGKLVPRAVKTRKEGDSTKLEVSGTIIRQVMSKGEAVLSGNAQDEFDQINSLKSHNIMSMACVPLICRGQTLGVLHVHSSGRRQVFVEEDLHLLTSICNQAAICVKNAQLFAQVEKETSLRRDFQRYMSPAVAQQIVQSKISVELGGLHRMGTVLFSDIVGFTSMSETREPGEVVALLNRYFRLTVGIIFRQEGTVNKFAGDAILAVWGAPLEVDRAELKAMAAGLGMQNATFRLNLELTAQGKSNIGMGIGINTGKFMAGNIGSDDRMEYTIIGDAVNLAARVESKATRAQVFANESTFQAASDRVSAVQLPPTPVKGKSEPIVMYSVRAAASPGLENDTELSIPVRCSAEGQPDAGCLLTRAQGPPGKESILTMLSPLPFDPGQEIRLVPQLPELPALSAFDCRVEEDEFGLATGTAEFTQVSLKVTNADERVLALLQPGQLIQSPLETLDGMRH